MSTALYNAMSAAMAQSRQLDVTAQNVANATTPGYRAQRMTFQAALDRATPQVAVADTTPDNSRGEIKVTDNPLDLALPEEGYFVVSTARGERLTRAGHFAVDAEGYVVDASGSVLESSGGTLMQVPPHAKSIAVGRDGTIEADGEVMGKVRVVMVPQQSLRSEGSYLAVDPQAPVTDLEMANVQSGALEGSNFDVVRGMVDLIRASRSYEAAVKTMQTVSDQQKRTARGVGSS